MNKKTKEIIKSYNKIKKEQFKARNLSSKDFTENKIEAIKFFFKEYGFSLKSMSKEEFYNHLLIEEYSGNIVIYFKWFDHKEELFAINRKYGYKKTLSKLSHLKTTYSESIKWKISKIISYSGDRLETFKKYGYQENYKEKNKSSGFLNYKNYFFRTSLRFYTRSINISSVYIDFSRYIPNKYSHLIKMEFSKMKTSPKSFSSILENQEEFMKEVLSELDVIIELIENLND